MRGDICWNNASLSIRQGQSIIIFNYHVVSIRIQFTVIELKITINAIESHGRPMKVLSTRSNK